MIGTYEKLPLRSQAVQWDGTNIEEIREFGAKVVAGPVHGFDGVLAIDTLEGSMKIVKGSWVIKGVVGEFYGCTDEVFQKTYKLVKPAKASK